MIREEISGLEAFCIPPESSFLTWLMPVFNDWSLSDCRSGRKDDFLRAVLAARKFDLWGLQLELIREEIDRNQPPDYAHLVQSVYQAYCRKSGKEGAQWGDKNNTHGWHLAEIVSLYPQARIVWVTRDPRDIWASLKELSSLQIPEKQRPISPKVPASVIEFCEQWVAYQTSVSRSIEKSRAEFVVIGYEDYVNDYAAHSNRLWDFLGVSHRSPAFKKRSSRALGPESTLVWKRGITGDITTQAVGRHKAELPRSDIAAIDSFLNSVGWPDLR